MSMLIKNARIVPGDGSPVIPRADVIINDDKIQSITPINAATEVADRRSTTDKVVEANGRVLMPAFVDCHTHAMWAGDRLDEYSMKLKGASYLDILHSGGGILSTVRAVRAATHKQLTENLLQRLKVMVQEGSTTIEVKSGYGLTTQDELKMLRAIADAASQFTGTIVPTALLGHAIDPDIPNYIDCVINDMLPAVSSEFPGITIDAFCEKSAWSVEDCRRLFTRAKELGHPVRLHTDQFNSMGGVDLCIELGAGSADHLEASNTETLSKLAQSGTYGVMLPACGFHLDNRFANGRALRHAGGKLAIATNCNPGSAPTTSMPFVIALAVRKLGLTCMESIQAATLTPAKLLGFEDRGALRVGQRADLVLLRHADERMLAFEFGGNPVDLTICNGKTV